MQLVLGKHHQVVRDRNNSLTLSIIFKYGILVRHYKMQVNIQFGGRNIFVYLNALISSFER